MEDPKILEELRKIAPVPAVGGNIDKKTSERSFA